MGTEPTLTDAREAVAEARAVVDGAIEVARGRGPAIHDDQEFLYDLSHAAAGVSMATIERATARAKVKSPSIKRRER